MDFVIPDSWPVLQALIRDNQNQGIDRVRVLCIGFMQQHTGWSSLLALEDRIRFNQRTLALLHWVTHFDCSAHRHEQLLSGGFTWWIYRAGASDACLQHRALDGTMAEPESVFWRIYLPPNGWVCSCYAVGAHSVSAARRRGGNPDKMLPSAYGATNARTGQTFGIDPEFLGSTPPSFIDCLHAIHRGVHDHE